MKCTYICTKRTAPHNVLTVEVNPE